MPLDCGLLCLLSERRRYVEILWRHRLLVTVDERKAKRRFLKLMRGFDSEDLEVLRKAVESKGLDIKACAPGPPMDIEEESESDEETPIPAASTARRQSVISLSRVRRYSTIRMDHLGGGATTITTVTPLHNHVRPGNHLSRHSPRQGNSSGRSDHERTPRASSRSREDPLSQRDLKLIGGTGEFEERGLIPQIDRPMSMPFLCCKLWRWKDLQVDAALHRLDPLPWCRFGRVTINNATVSCCNPFHYGLWIRPELSNSSDEKNSGTLANGGGTAKTEEPPTADRSIGHVRSAFRSNRPALPPSEDTPPPLPPPPVPIDDSTLLNNTPLLNHLASIHSHALSWGRMIRWERKERIGDSVPLFGQFVAVGKLAGTVFDGQDVKATWDIENHSSFALIRQTETEEFEDIWLYNSGDRPIFLCISQTANRSPDAIRRLSPGYCLRVHRSPTIIRSDETEDQTEQKNDVSFLTLSIGVGWGSNYQRLVVGDTPCRYEIVFN